MESHGQGGGGQAPGQPGLPAAGWYADPQGPGGWRWWDGSQWTEHTHRPEPVAPVQPEPVAQAPQPAQQPATQAPLDPALPQGQGSSPSQAAAAAQAIAVLEASRARTESGKERSFPTTILALVGIAIVLAIGSLILLNSLSDDEEGGQGPGQGGASITTPIDAGSAAADTDTIAQARLALVAMETYSTDNDGTYHGVDATTLAALEPGLASANLVAAPDGTGAGYQITLTSPGGRAYTISRDQAGLITYSCTPPGEGGCPANGAWG